MIFSKKIISNIYKKFIINFFGLFFLFLNLPILFFSLFFPKTFRRKGIFFGGIPFKSSGGPYQKIILLKKFLGEQNINFKTIYIISGSLRIPLYILKIYKVLKVKILINQNGVFYPTWYKKNDLKRRNKILFQYNQTANITLFQSKFALKSYRKFVGEIPPNYRLLYNTVNHEDFYPISNNSSTKKIKKILVAGNFYNESEDYRVILSIEVINSLIKKGLNLKLIIAGNLSDRLINKINKNNLRFIEFFGPYNPKNANKLFNSADFYLHLHYMGCCDNILLEIMACGLHIIALNNGGNPELLMSDYSTLIPCPNNWEKQIMPDVDEISKYVEFSLGNKIVDKTKLVDHVKSKFSIEKWILTHKEIINS